MLVRGGHVGSQPRLRLHRVRQGEVGGERGLGTQVEMAAGGSMGMLRPLKGSTWKRRAQRSRGPAAARADQPRGCPPRARVGQTALTLHFQKVHEKKTQMKENKPVNADYKKKC